MSLPVLVTVGLIVVGIIALVLLKKVGGSSGQLPYLPSKALFSEAERSFLGVLDQAVGPEHRVFGKVRIADLAMVKPGLKNSARTIALNRVAAKDFDFVVCRVDDLAVVCIVELNDKSHAGARAVRRDAFVSGVCQAIALPLITIPAKHTYSPMQIRDHFAACLPPKPTA